jgi:hypothetical protein
MSVEHIPDGFTDEFLDWFRDRTEATWADYKPKALADYAAHRVGGMDWQPGTRWLGGLSEAESDQIEQRWSLPFPPDYRRFLRRLHAPDQSMRGAHSGPLPEGGTGWVPWERPALPNWLTDEEALRDRWDWLVDGLSFDVVNNDLRPPS